MVDGYLFFYLHKLSKHGFEWNILKFSSSLKGLLFDEINLRHEFQVRCFMFPCVLLHLLGKHGFVMFAKMDGLQTRFLMPDFNHYVYKKNYRHLSVGFMMVHENPLDIYKMRCKPRGVGSTFVTPPKFNMEPENKSLEKESPFGNHYVQVPC